MKTDIYIKKIIEDTGLNRKDIQEMVKEKKMELKGLISEEGALFIIAKELNVDLSEANKERESGRLYGYEDLSDTELAERESECLEYSDTEEENFLENFTKTPKKLKEKIDYKKLLDEQYDRH